MEKNGKVNLIVDDAAELGFTLLLLLENLAAHNANALATLQKMGDSENWWKEDLASMKEEFYAHGYKEDEFIGRVIDKCKAEGHARETVKAMLSKYYVFNDENAESYLQKYWEE